MVIITIRNFARKAILEVKKLKDGVLKLILGGFLCVGAGAALLLFAKKKL